MKRMVKRIVRMTPVTEGAGVALHRGFGFGDTEDFDPFLLFDDFSSTHHEDYEAGFPWHPHRGIETVTYILKGEVMHEDSIGNKGSIGAGDIQWMSAGSGIVHQEMPQVHEGGIQGFQLWVNLPRTKKMSDPKYQDIRDATVPTVEHDGAQVRIISGSYRETEGPVHDIAGNPTYLDVSLSANSSFQYPTLDRDTVFIYVIDGDVIFREKENEQWIRGNEIALTTLGNEFSVIAGQHGARFLLISGSPLKEPVAWNGPIVMNTREELVEAFRELQDGTFIRNPAPKA